MPRNSNCLDAVPKTLNIKLHNLNVNWIMFPGENPRASQRGLSSGASSAISIKLSLFIFFIINIIVIINNWLQNRDFSFFNSDFIITFLIINMILIINNWLQSRDFIRTQWSDDWKCRKLKLILLVLKVIFRKISAFCAEKQKLFRMLICKGCEDEF